MDAQDQNDLPVSGVPQEVEAYINYYGLKGDPFDPAKPLVFATRPLEKALRLFNYLARFSRKLVVMTGSEGAGKSTLLGRFAEGQDQASKLCVLTADSEDSAEQVLYAIATQLNVPDMPDQRVSTLLRESIQRFALACQNRDICCLIVVDDAEKFDASVLEAIYQLAYDASGQRCGISLLLCGQPQLVDRVKRVVPSDEFERTVFHQPIVPFNRDEVIQCLRFHFIENAGIQKPPFSQAEYDAIFEQSKGLPGRVKSIAQNMLLAGVSGVLLAGERDNKAKQKPFFVALVASLIIAAGLLLWESSQFETSVPVEKEVELVGQIDRLEEGGAPPLFVDDEEPSVLLGAASLETEGLEAEVEGGDAAGTLESIDEVKVEEPIDPLDTALITEGNDRGVEPNEVAVIEEAVATRAGETLLVESATRLQADEAKILAFDSAGYTLQLLGSHKEASILKVLDSLSANDDAMYFQKVHKGEPWYVLIYGYFPDKAAANSATLPKSLQSFKPWVRPIAAIQETIKKAP